MHRRTAAAACRPEKIASVTWLSRNPSGSNVANLAEQVPINHGLAEQVVAADPDLVLAGTFTARIAVGMLKRTAIPVVEFGVPRSFDEVRQQIRDVAALVQAEDKGRQLIDEIDRRVAAVAGKPRAMRPTAVVLNPNGATVGQGTLADQIMTAAGSRQHRRDASHRQLRRRSRSRSSLCTRSMC